MTLNHQKLTTSSWAAIAVVVVGWLLGAATTHLLKPAEPATLNGYLTFYVTCLIMRNALFVFSACLLYAVRGSVAIWVLMGFNLFAIVLNMLYLDPNNYAAISTWRVGLFAPTYKAAEIIILIWMCYNVRADLLHIARRVGNSIYSMVTRGRVQF